MARTTDIPYDEVTKSPWFTVLITGAMFSVLILLRELGGGKVNALYFYVIFFLMIVTFGANQTDFSRFSKVMGFDEPYGGFNILLAFSGIGFAFVLYGLVYKPAMAIAAGTPYASWVKPFYLPQAISMPGAGLLALTGVGGVLYYMWVAITEEQYKNFIFKNLTNYLTSKGVRFYIASFASFILALLIWGGLHFIAWSGLTVSSVIFALLWGLAFWLTYFIPDVTGILSPKEPMKWEGVLLAGAWTSHAVWDILVTQGSPIPVNQLVMSGAALAVMPLVLMYLIREYKSTTKLVPLEWK